MISGWALLAGAVIGAGLAGLIAALTAPVPELRAALARLDGTDTPTTGMAQGAGSWRGWWHRRAPGWASRLGLDRYRADLALIGSGPEQLLRAKAGYALLGFAFPPVMVTVMALLGLALPIVIPAAASLVLAGGLFFVPELDLHRRATQTREQLRRAVCLYLELVALERAADAGAVEAMDRAAAIGDGRAFHLITDALLRARLHGTAPWHGLSDLAVQLRVPELGDVADIMALSGTDGAAVYATLRARAAALRTAILAGETARANETSEHLVVPVALLGITFLALLVFPAFFRILYG